MNEKLNVIIKAGPRAKWYLKQCPKDLIDSEIKKQRSWRDISHSTMWIGIYNLIRKSVKYFILSV